MGTIARVSVEDYLKDQNDARYEYVDGVLIEKFEPTWMHAAVFAKCERYHDWGVPTCWVIDPVKRRAWSYERDGEPVIQESSLEAGEIKLPLAEIFSILDGAAH